MKNNNKIKNISWMKFLTNGSSTVKKNKSKNSLKFPPVVPE